MLNPQLRKSAQNRKEALGVRESKVSRRLVEEDELRAGAQCAGDFDELTLMQIEAAHRPVERGNERRINHCERLGRKRPHLAAINPPKRVAAMRQVNIFCDRQIGKKRKFLENDCDCARVVVLAARHRNDAGVATEGAGHNPDEGRFAGPIAAKQRVNFTLRNAKVGFA